VLPKAGLPQLEVTLDAVERDWIQAHRVLRLGVSRGYEPFEVLRGRVLKGILSKSLFIKIILS
jgi:hypothetical protein